MANAISSLAYKPQLVDFAVGLGPPPSPKFPPEPTAGPKLR